MAKQRHRNNTAYNRRPSQQKKTTNTSTPVRLSQCMIVKNEEKNIEKALSWAKDIAFEQIVVDTGSTDRTVEIAESMGAKVYHFQWIDDFSAAKNFALEKASGNWIAFLDADEFFSPEDAEKVMTILKQINSDSSFREKCFAIRTPLANVNNEGNPFVMAEQIRIYRNKPDLRYTGRIHEMLSLTSPPYWFPDATIIHTGYSNNSFSDVGKGKRNILMLETELAQNPSDANLMSYLADSLRIPGETQDFERAESLYIEALDSGMTMYPLNKLSAYAWLIPRFSNREEIERAEVLCVRALSEFPDNPDFNYYYGILLNLAKRYSEALQYLTKAESMLKDSSITASMALITNAKLLFFHILSAVMALGDTRRAVHYAMLVLKEDKYQSGILIPALRILQTEGGSSDEELVEFMKKIYDYTKIKDKLFLARAMKDAGSIPLAQYFMSLITPEERAWMQEGSVSPEEVHPA